MATPNDPPERSDLAARVRRLIAARAGAKAEIGGDLPLAELGLDSVALVDLLLECERLSGGRLPPEILEGAPVTVGELVLALTAPAPDRP
jgi:acyl carrier protein